MQKTDIRIVAATNVDLLKAVANGKFREDLYYRLSTIIIRVPNLHDRGADIPLLARKFARDFSEKYVTEPITFSPEAQHLMELYRWPGNVRQLKNIVEQLAIFEAGKEISRDTLAMALPHADGNATPARLDDIPTYEKEREMLWKTILGLQNEIGSLRAEMASMHGDGRIYGEPPLADREQPIPTIRSIIRYEPEDRHMAEPAQTLEDSERETIIAALSRNEGNRQRAAKELDISPRTLYRKIKELGITD